MPANFEGLFRRMAGLANKSGERRVSNTRLADRVFARPAGKYRVGDIVERAKMRSGSIESVFHEEVDPYDDLDDEPSSGSLAARRYTARETMPARFRTGQLKKRYSK